MTAYCPPAQEQPHYWLIETPSGPMSRGVCRWCAAVRYFPNSVPAAAAWGRDEISISDERVRVRPRSRVCWVDAVGWWRQ